MPILSAVALPVAALGLMYKSVDIPTEEFGDLEPMSLTEMVSENIDQFLTDNTTESTIGLAVAQSDMNKIILEQLRTMNPNYLVDGAPDEEKNYVMVEEYYAFQGAWVTFKEDIIQVEAGVHAFYQGYTFKTRILLAFQVTIDTDEVVLRLEDLSIGNLPLAWSFSTASWIAEQVLGESIDDLITGQLNGIATYDPVEREIRLNVDNVIQETIEDEQQKAMIQSLLAFIEENELLDIGFEENEFAVNFALGKTKDDSTPFVVPDAQRIMDDTDLEAILSSKASAMIFSTLSSDNPSPFVDLDQFTLNRMFEYFMRGNQASPGVLVESVILENYTMNALVPYVTMDDDFVVNIPIILQDINDANKRFQSIIKIKATPEISGSDLRIILEELVAGEVTLSQEHIGNILTMLGNNNFIVDGAFVIENFDEQMDAAGMGIESVAVVGDSLRIYVTLAQTIPVEEIQQAVQDVLEVVNGNPEYPEELNQAIDDVLTEVLDPAGEPEAAVEELLVIIEGLSDEEQQMLFDDLVAAFEGTDLNYEELFGLLPEMP